MLIVQYYPEMININYLICLVSNTFICVPTVTCKTQLTVILRYEEAK